MDANTDTKPAQSLTITLPQFKPRHISGGSFLAALLLFFLPFLNIKCNDQKIASITGKDFVTGFKMKDKAGDSFFGGMFKNKNKNRGADADNSDSTDKSKDEIEKPNKLAITGLILGVAAFALIFFRFRYATPAAAVASGIAAVSLLCIYLDYQSKVKELDSSMGISISMSFTIWYFLCIILFATGAYFSYKAYLYDEGKKHRAEMDEYMKKYENTELPTDGATGIAGDGERAV